LIPHFYHLSLCLFQISELPLKWILSLVFVGATLSTKMLKFPICQTAEVILAATAAAFVVVLVLVAVEVLVVVVVLVLVAVEVLVVVVVPVLVAVEVLVVVVGASVVVVRIPKHLLIWMILFLTFVGAAL